MIHLDGQGLAFALQRLPRSIGVNVLAGSDARVVSTSAASLSSEPFGKLVSDDKDTCDEGSSFE